MPQNNTIRPIAIYLPQYHPIPENDKWWGKGFTEWTNVSKAKPLFKGHYQPHFPADLGYYDLRVPEVMQAQIKLAKDAGIYGFMFYHYWFEGKRLLEKPLENYLADKSLDFPFCFCWANENWTRRWNGKDEDILMKQDYSEDDYSHHFDEVLLKFFRDERYIKIDGKPVIAIYKTDLIPSPEKLALVWNKKATENGFNGVYMIRVEATDKATKPKDIAFDASMDFQPNWKILKKFTLYPSLAHKVEKIKRRVYNKLGKKINNNANTIVDYKQYSRFFYQFNSKGIIRYPCIMPSWDNSSRRTNGKAIIFHNATPDNYAKWLQELLRSYQPFSEEENLFFINAWNEWAEGNHLEPCQKWGNSYLEVTKKVLDSFVSKQS